MRITSGRPALRALYRGVSDLAKLVSVTYGPNGGKVIVDKLGNPLVTTDGAALAREMQFGDLRRIGVSLARSASSKTDDTSGDGTTTTLILVGAILEAALAHYSPVSWDPVGIVRGIREGLPLVEAQILQLVRDPTPEILHRVALMAAHGDDLVASSIVGAIERVGENGTILLKAGEGVGIETEVRDGLVLDQGWCAHGMAPQDGKGERELEGPLVATVAHPLSTFQHVQSLMEEASQWPGRGLVLFCHRLYGDALTTILLNHNKGVLPCVAISYSGPPQGLDDWLEDIAAVTNASVVSPASGMDLTKFDASWLGYARKATVSKSKTEIFSYMDDVISQRIDARVLALMAQAETTSFEYDRDRSHERASALDGGLCTLKIGGYTAQEAQDRRSRAEDTLHAVQACLSSGVVPGAGRAFQYASYIPELQTQLGGTVLAQALKKPLSALATREGVAPNVVLSVRSEDPWVGWDPLSGSWRNFLDPPQLVDSTGVVVQALRSAVSVACQILLTEVLISR